MKKKTEEKAAIAPPAAAERPKFLQSRDVRQDHDDSGPVPVKWGPRTGIESRPLDELATKAKPEELREFAEIVNQRRAGEAGVWLKCDGPMCGFVGRFKAEHQGAACMKCNWRMLQHLGHLRPMTEAAVADYQREQAKKNAETDRRIEAAAFDSRNRERASSGLAPLTLATFREERRAEYLRRVENDKRLQGIVDEGRRLRAERMRESQPEKA